MSSSVVIFDVVTAGLQEWRDEQGTDTEGKFIVAKTLHRLSNRDKKLYPLLSEALYRFYRKKTGKYQKCCVSQESFKELPAWRLAITCVCIVRCVFLHRCL
jgi:hypothetical protein